MHTSIDVAPTTVPYVPVGHGEHIVWPTSANVPAGQEVQLELAGVEEYVPAAQSVHDAFDVAPDAELFVPAGHAVHDADDVWPTSALNVPAEQEMQVELAGVEEYVPASQSVHVAFDVAPDAELLVPAGHAVHDADDVWPTSALNVPAGQDVHNELAGVDEYVPSGHIKQLVALVCPNCGPYEPAGQA